MYTRSKQKLCILCKTGNDPLLIVKRYYHIRLKLCFDLTWYKCSQEVDVSCLLHLDCSLSPLVRLIEVSSYKLAIVYFWFASTDDKFRPLYKPAFATIHLKNISVS